MGELIAYCGLDCGKCEARLATLNDDDDLRAKVAKRWSELNNVEITSEMINCEGCRVDGVKTVFCDELCQIRQCAMRNGFRNCGECEDVKDCGKVSMVISNNAEARERLTGLRNDG